MPKKPSVEERSFAVAAQWSVKRNKNCRRFLKELAKSDKKLLTVVSQILSDCSDIPMKLGDETGALYLGGLANLVWSLEKRLPLKKNLNKKQKK